MKKTILRNTLAIASAAFLFASCASDHGLTIEKRHYRNGYYVSTGKSHDVASSSSVRIAPAATAPVNNETVLSSGNAQTASVTDQKTTPTIAQKKTPAAASRPGRSSVILPAIFPHAVHKAQKMNSAKKPASAFPSSEKTGHTDDNTLLLIILCFLLPWLAVLLKEGGPTTYFWISLLLWLCFWIPGVIFALLVVLDVI
ncbi:MAG TPA: YqaE/Pmp3 family membrane protein [Bacteroidia bacterium]|nr:YqaE/Pmp3 family membrane protein [Bacteroidia bacterium]